MVRIPLALENWRAITLASVDDGGEEVKAALTTALPPGIVPLATRSEEMQSVLEYTGEGTRQELRLLVFLDSRESALCDAHGTREEVSEAFTFRPVYTLGKGKHGAN
jgi:hypothetical protein